MSVLRKLLDLLEMRKGDSNQLFHVWAGKHGIEKTPSKALHWSRRILLLQEHQQESYTTRVL
jgi:hypothetical protein